MLKSTVLKTGLGDEDIWWSPTEVWGLWCSLWSLYTFWGWRWGGVFDCGITYLIIDVGKNDYFENKRIQMKYWIIFIYRNLSTK